MQTVFETKASPLVTTHLACLSHTYCSLVGGNGDDDGAPGILNRRVPYRAFASIPHLPLPV